MVPRLLPGPTLCDSALTQTALPQTSCTHTISPGSASLGRGPCLLRVILAPAMSLHIFIQPRNHSRHSYLRSAQRNRSGSPCEQPGLTPQGYSLRGSVLASLLHWCSRHPGSPSWRRFQRREDTRCDLAQAAGEVMVLECSSAFPPSFLGGLGGSGWGALKPAGPALPSAGVAPAGTCKDLPPLRTHALANHGVLWSP